MKRLIFFLPILIMVFSCTVTKRLHRPGYHVEWNHQNKKVTSTKEVKSEKESLAISRKMVNEESTNFTVVSAIKQENSAPTQTEIIDAPTEIIDFSDQTHPETTKHSEDLEKNSLVENFHTTEKTTRPLLWRWSGRDLQILGKALMILGGLLLLGSILSALGWFAAPGSSSSVGGGSGSDAGYYFFEVLLLFIGTSDWLWILIAIIVAILFIYFFVLIVDWTVGPFWGAIIGVSLIAIGFAFLTWGKNRQRIEDS